MSVEVKSINNVIKFYHPKNNNKKETMLFIVIARNWINWQLESYDNSGIAEIPYQIDLIWEFSHNQLFNILASKL